MMLKLRIETKVKDTFSPLYLKVEDESHLHIGHANHQPGKETHFAITVVSETFRNQTRIKRHQQMYACLEEEIRDGLHALCLRTLSPEEAEEASTAQV